MKKVLSLVLAVMMLLGMMSFASAEEEIVLNVWSFTNELEGMINKYYLPSHPNVKINYVIYPTDGGEYTSKVDAIMASAAASDEAPDIFTLEAAFVKKYVNSPVTADLAKVGITEADVAAAIPVMKQIGTNTATGELKGLSWQATPGALMYRASLAEKYLGVTSPEEFQAKVADWDLFMETAAELNEASEGAVKMVVGEGDIWNAFNYNREQGWVVDGKLVIDPVLYDFLDNSKLFQGTVEPASRSLMNVPFITGDKDMDAKFVKAAEAAGFVNLKGHRLVGGMRASIYNAMPIEGVSALVDFMAAFEKENR